MSPLMASSSVELRLLSLCLCLFVAFYWRQGRSPYTALLSTCLCVFPRLSTCILKSPFDFFFSQPPFFFFFFASLSRHRGDVAELQPLCSPCVPAVTASACRRARGTLGSGCPNFGSHPNAKKKKKNHSDSSAVPRQCPCLWLALLLLHALQG